MRLERIPAGLRHPGVLAALASAALFGAAAPAAKVILGTGVNPWVLAGLFYLGSGIGMGATAAVTRCPRPRLPCASLARLAAAVSLGGIVGPVLLMLGLQHLPATQASLLLTTEGILTALLAWTLFGEQVTRGLVMGMLLIVAGAVVLSLSGRQASGPPWAMVAVVAACACWAADNNLTRDVVGIEPVWLATIKGLIAGPVNLSLGLSTHASLPSAGTAVTAMLIGWAAYGVSITLFIAALRAIGTARTGAYFGLAPFIGAALAVALGDAVTPTLLIAALSMATGTYLHLIEDHHHRHPHHATTHTHDHRHDDQHHGHRHPGGATPASRHTHPHDHEPTSHAHHHYPDAHHRHHH